MGAGQMIPLDLSKHWSCFLQTRLSFNLLRRTTPEMFMGTGFANRDEHQERENPTQFYSPAPDSAPQPLLFILRPTRHGSPSPLSSGHGWDCLSRDWSLPSDVRKQEGLQVKLQAWFISLRLKAEQTSPAGQSQAQHPPRAQHGFAPSFHASEPFMRHHSLSLRNCRHSCSEAGDPARSHLTPGEIEPALAQIPRVTW